MPFKFSVNIPAVISSAFICFSLLALWFSPAMFGELIAKYRQREGREASLPRFALQWLFVLLFCCIMDVVVDSIGSAGLQQGIAVGITIWLLVSFIHLAVSFRFDKNSLIVKGIYSGFFLVASVISAALLSMWR